MPFQTMVDMTAEHPVNEILAIRRYRTWSTLYSVKALSDAVHPSVESKQSVWKTRVNEFHCRVS